MSKIFNYIAEKSLDYTPAEFFESNYNEMGGITINKYVGTLPKVAIPPVIKGKPVNVIGCNAFTNCHIITDISIPHSVNTIEKMAFWNCKNLKEVEICINNVEIIEKSAFASCEALERFFIGKGQTKIMDDVFSGCTSLTEVILTNGVSYIGSSAFSLCTSLVDIKIPHTVEAIGDSVFSFCTSLSRVILSNKMTVIPFGTFGLCASLSSLYVPENITTVSENAFSDCPYLTICGRGNSYIESYAKEKGIPFKKLNAVYLKLVEM